MLEAELAANSRNSSRPPSTDNPGKTLNRRKDSSGRKQGAQDGHQGRGRDLLPTTVADEVIEHWPHSCDCGHLFTEAERVAIGEPVRAQVEELPQIAVRLIEHQCPRVNCPGCGRAQRAPMPSNVAASALSARVCRLRSPRWPCVTASLAMTRSSSAKNSSGRGSAPVRSRRFSPGPPPRLPSPAEIS